MEKEKNRIRVWLGRFLEGVLYTLFSLILIFILLLGLINIPAVQTKVVNEVSEYISSKINFPISIERVNISWFDNLILEGVRVNDPQGFEMIKVEALTVDFKVSSIFQNNVLNLDEVDLEGASVTLIKDSATRDLNIDTFIQAISNAFSSDSQPSAPSKPVKFTIDKVNVINSYFKYSDLKKDSISDGFDYNHFSFDSINSVVKNFTIIRDTIEIDIRNLRAKEDNLNFPLHDVSTFFRYTKRSMQFQNLLGKVGSSVVKDSLVFEYNDIDDLSDFNEKVRIVANIKDSEIATKDLALFAPDLSRYDDVWKVTGKSSGTVQSLRVRNFELNFGQFGSTLKGNLRTDGLPDFFESFIELDLKPSLVFALDVAQYVDDEVTNEVLQRISSVSFKGKFLGFPDDFVANGEFFSPVGYVKSDVNFKLDVDSLKGSIKTTKLSIGKITGSTDEVQEIDMQGNVEGKGFKLRDASYKLNANIRRIGLFKYDYRNITTNATLKNQFFEGKLDIKDSNLVMRVLGKIDLREKQEVLNLTAEIDTAFLKPLNITKRNAIISTKVNINTKGIILDEIVGDATFKNTYVRLENNEAIIDSLYFNSRKEPDRRTFYLWSDPLEVNIDGQFQFTSVYQDVPNLFYEYYINFLHNKKTTSTYYSEKAKKPVNEYGMNFQFNFKDINPVIHLFNNDVSVSNNVIFKGRFVNGNVSSLNFNTYLDSLNYKDYTFKEVELGFTSSKESNKQDVVANAFIHSKNQKLSSFLNTKDFVFEGNWNEKRIDFNTFIQERDVENILSFDGTLDFLPDASKLHINSSLIKVLNNEWAVSPDNEIAFTTENIIFRDFAITNQSQSFSIEGELADTAIIRANNFDLKVLQPLVSKKISGRLNGFVNIKDYYNDLILDSNLSLDSLIYDELLIGNFATKSEWNKLKKVIESQIVLDRGGQKILTAEGDYNPYSKDSAISINAKLNQTNLVLFEPFIEDYLSKLDGTASGQIHIGGNFNNIYLNGEAFIKNAAFTVNYLNTTYTFNDWIYFTEDGIVVKNLRLRDVNNNIGIMDGGIYYDSFKNFIIYFSGKLDNFQVLNTSVENNELFYGTAMVTGNFEAFGAFNSIDIRANARSNKGTKIFIPLGGYDEVQEADFIRFVSKTDTTERVALQQKQVDLSGIRLDFNLDVTPETMVELIFDAQAGDIIRGYGTGQIKMNIDTKGEFTMFGNYQIARGGYNFTLANLINKEFDILPNSSIAWYGDPYRAILNIEAAYEQRVSYLPILTSIAAEDRQNATAQMRRPYPVTVKLAVRGELLSPDIDYKIEFKDFPAQITTPSGPKPILLDVQTFENNISLNEQERNRQVFSLLILRQLQPVLDARVDINNASGSVSELLSNQLSYWASQYDENLDIQVNLNGFDADAFNTFQLRVSYSALGGRLRVTREGGFTNLQNQANFVSIAGEWTVEYDLTQDGIFRLKLYNRNNYNSYDMGLQQTTTGTTGGLSIMHTQSFNTLKELGLFKKRKFEDESEDETDDSDDDVLPQTLNNKATKKEENYYQSDDFLPGNDD